jgi:hypothetical protein
MGKFSSRRYSRQADISAQSGDLRLILLTLKKGK